MRVYLPVAEGAGAPDLFEYDASGVDVWIPVGGAVRIPLGEDSVMGYVRLVYYDPTQFRVVARLDTWRVNPPDDWPEARHEHIWRDGDPDFDGDPRPALLAGGWRKS